MRHERAAGVFSVAFDVMRASVYLSLLRVFLPILEKMRRGEISDHRQKQKRTDD